MSAATNITIKRLSSANEDEFFRVHGGGPCHCVAWWVPTWEGWSERSAADNARLRRGLFDANVHDGYLIYRDIYRRLQTLFPEIDRPLGV